MTNERIHNIRISNDSYVFISDLLHMLLQVDNGGEIEFDDEVLANALADFTDAD